MARSINARARTAVSCLVVSPKCTTRVHRWGRQQLQTRTTTAPRPLTGEAYCHPATLPRTVTATFTPVVHLDKQLARDQFWRER
eukprot:87215-Heterocapsa_arctica.AAC.1